MQNLKILALSYAFPPMAYPRSIQVSRLLANLASSVKVICGECRFEKIDETIMPNSNDIFSDVIRVPFNMSKISQCLSLFDNNRFIPLFSFPDKQRRWVRKASNYFLKYRLDSKYKPDLLMTFSTPVSDHIFGLEYKKRTGTRWIAHFSDPWSDNPFFRNNMLTGWLHKCIEKRIIENSDAVIFTSPETIDLVMRKYPSSWKKKVFCIPHCLDRTLYNATLKPPEDCYVLRSIGSFYGLRSPLSLYKAIERIGNRFPNLLKDVSFELVGLLGRFQNMIKRYPIARQVVKFIGSVSYAESLRLMQTAHCLLVIDAPSVYSVFFPSKLVDYIGTNRFIMAISPPGATARVVKEVGGVVADPSDVNAIVATLRNVLKQKPKRLPLSTYRYDKNVVSKEMIRVIDRVAGG